MCLSSTISCLTQPTLFLAQATSRSHEGTGIGLALTKVNTHDPSYSCVRRLTTASQELVRLHGGNLSVTSTPQRDDEEMHGSTFTVTIPVGHAHIPKVHIDEGSPTTNTQRSYARGIIDEASQSVFFQYQIKPLTHTNIRWGRGPALDATTPSDTSEEGGGSLSSGDSGTVFFKRSDVVLVGACILACEIQSVGNDPQIRSVFQLMTM